MTSWQPFDTDSTPQLEAKYGLPAEVRYCTRCVISNQRPNSAVEYQHTTASRKQTIAFDDQGVCSACRVAEMKAQTNWFEREQELLALCDRHRSNDGSYDCLVPGSGGKDSFYQAHILKYKYGMHPLTITWAPHLYTDWGRRNHQRWIDAGFDNILVSANSRVHRLLTRLAVENLFHPFQPFMLGQKLLAPRMAMRFGIPLIFYGENEAEYGNSLADAKKAERSRNYFASEDRLNCHLGGVSVTELISRYGLTLGDLDMYLPSRETDVESAGIAVHYLGYYLKWKPQEMYYYACEHGGFECSPHRTPGTYSKYNSIDDKIDDLHYWTTYIKFGIGRATYDAAQEIRSGDITREEGIALVKRFDGEWPARFADELMAYLSLPFHEFPVASQQFERPIIDTDYFRGLAVQFRSPHLWDGDRLRQPIFEVLHER